MNKILQGGLTKGFDLRFTLGSNLFQIFYCFEKRRQGVGQESKVSRYLDSEEEEEK